MDIFRFLNPQSDTLLEQGQIVNGITELMWIERYRDYGEFEITAPLTTDVREQLPIGSLVSHVDTQEVMIVENHEVKTDKGAVPNVRITGRGFESILEQRIVGYNQAMPANAVDYVLAAGYTWNQAVALINKHIQSSQMLDPTDGIPHVQTTTNVTGTGASEQRTLKTGQLYPAVLELLEVDDLGLRTLRPGSWSSPTETYFRVYRGVDRSAEVIFSHDAGDINKADYLWSIKSEKNSVMMATRWLQSMIRGPETGYDRRMMYYDVSFLDSDLSAPPSGQQRTDILNAMDVLGRAALARRKRINLAKAEVARTSKRYMFRKDYDIGDIVTVAGDFNETTKMRVIEYVEIDDSSGESGYPTLAVV